MSFSLTFLNYSWLWPVLLGGLILGSVFFWKEWRTSGQHRLTIKIILSFIALISLALIILKPAVLGDGKENVIFILTKHFKQQDLDSLKKSYRRSTLIDYRNTQDLSKVKQASQVFLLGSGLPSFELWRLEETPVTYLPGKELSGIVKLNYKTQNLSGKNLEVDVEYANPKENHRVVLEDASGNVLDSIILSPLPKQSFKLSSPLNVAGKFVYSITEKDSTGKLLNRHPLPLRIETAEPLAILILNYYSIFEVKYLKRFLADFGYEVSVKNRITSGRFKFDFYNQQAKNLSRLNSSVLEYLDLVILDAETLQLLTTSEQNQIQNSVRNEGLGVLILGESRNSGTLGDKFKSAIRRDRATEVILDPWPEIELQKKAFNLERKLGLEDIHASGSKLISAYKRLGMGRVGMTALTNTWQLKLRGSDTIYQQIWSELIEKISKRSQKTTTWLPQQELAILDEPFKFKLKTKTELPVVKTGNMQSISLRQDVIQPKLWSGRTYPKNRGWQELRLEQDTTAIFPFYVYESTDWQAIQEHNNRTLNTRVFSKNFKKSITYKSLIAINPLWFFCSFLLSMGGLWIEPKL